MYLYKLSISFGNIFTAKWTHDEFALSKYFIKMVVSSCIKFILFLLVSKHISERKTKGIWSESVGACQIQDVFNAMGITTSKDFTQKRMHANNGTLLRYFKIRQNVQR